MAIEFDSTDCFYRDLNPDLHFKPTGGGHYRLTSVALGPWERRGDYSESSADSARLVAIDVARASRAARGHTHWGTLRLTYPDLVNHGSGEAFHAPENGNDAHCALYFQSSLKAQLVRVAEVLDAPTSSEWARAFPNGRSA